jgi:hypothetical protein
VLVEGSVSVDPRKDNARDISYSVASTLCDANRVRELALTHSPSRATLTHEGV